MITLNVRKDRKGNVILLDFDSAKVTLNYRKSQPVTLLDKKLKAMWDEFDYWVKSTDATESDKRQQNKINMLLGKHFNLGGLLFVDMNDDQFGWPCRFWKGNKTFINRYIRKRRP